jgi:hypothetical protein
MFESLIFNMQIAIYVLQSQALVLDLSLFNV